MKTITGICLTEFQKWRWDNYSMTWDKFKMLDFDYQVSVIVKFLMWNDIVICPTIEWIGSDEIVHAYEITHEPNSGKRMCQRVETIKSFNEGYGSYTGGWDTRTEAMQEAIKHATKIYNERSEKP